MKLKGSYKGTRKRHVPAEIIWIECPACGWRGHPAKVQKAESEYVKHLELVHYGILECAFCNLSAGRGLRLLPDFATLAAHVQHFHPEVVQAHERSNGTALAQGALVPKSFR